MLSLSDNTIYKDGKYAVYVECHEFIEFLNIIKYTNLYNLEQRKVLIIEYETVMYILINFCNDNNLLLKALLFKSIREIIKSSPVNSSPIIYYLNNWELHVGIFKFLMTTNSQLCASINPYEYIKDNKICEQFCDMAHISYYVICQNCTNCQNTYYKHIK